MPGPTVKELKAQAKAQGVKGYSTMKKAELIKVLDSSPARSPVPQKVTYRWQVLLSNAVWEIGTGKKPKDALGFVDFGKKHHLISKIVGKSFRKILLLPYSTLNLICQ